MRTRWTSVAALWAALASLTASARLGETPGQCMERYGAPVAIDVRADTMEFRKAGVYILVTFFAGRADSITFWKLARSQPGGVQWLSVPEIHALLRANAQGESWQPGFPSNGLVAYSEGDGVDPWHTTGPIGLAAYYHYRVGAQHLSIKTMDHIRRKQAAEWATLREKARRRATGTGTPQRLPAGGF